MHHHSSEYLGSSRDQLGTNRDQLEFHLWEAGCIYIRKQILTYVWMIFSSGIAPNQVIARSEFEVHRQIYTE